MAEETIFDLLLQFRIQDIYREGTDDADLVFELVSGHRIILVDAMTITVHPEEN